MRHQTRRFRFSPILTALLFIFTVEAFQNCTKFGSSSVSDSTLSQSSYSNLMFSSGLFGLHWNLPYGGGPLSTSSNYLYASQVTANNSTPDCSSPVRIDSEAVSLAPTLPVAAGQTRIFSQGQIQWTSNTGTFNLSCSGEGFQRDYLADDGSTVLYSVLVGNYSVIPLNGMLSASPEEFMASIPLENWMSANYIAANAKWLPGAAYVKHQTTVVNSYIVVQNCDLSPTVYNTDPISCGAGTLDSFFPYLIESSNSHPTEYDQATDGAITTNAQGDRVWTATQPLPLTASSSYRVFFELNGNIYMGTQHQGGKPYVYLQPDGSFVDYTVDINGMAVSSIGNSFIFAGTTAGSVDGATAEVTDSVDLFGLGGHGLNGSLAPEDLALHYSLPSALNGAGQTIAVVDGPASGDMLSDLNTMSQYYGLPTLQTCTTASTSSPCFQQVDLSAGAPIPSGQDWGIEPALDLQAAHAIAPNASLVLVTAVSSNSNDLASAVQMAAQIPGVIVVSMSFSGSAPAIYDQIFTSHPEIAFLASSGDTGNLVQATYPAASIYATAVGGTRVRSLATSGSATSDSVWSFTTGGPGNQLMPPWQVSNLSSGVVSLNNGLRALPDVAAVADAQHSPFAVYYKQAWHMVGGTSLASPLWAGIVALYGQALTNQQKSLSGALLQAAPNGGGLNVLLYSAKTNAGTTVLNDILSGSNNLTGACTYCTPGPGFNDVTGLGTPNVSNLITELLKLEP